ncbi:S-adenosyl-L-methionine-dependent methyltransferase [Microdochium trichocladiopsis]|uniref:S-adenosyl-L-methionine-dependent methyltransferase n=1 Tax=Microdochium trichocladiopsis TaxID=1682393 RepID=A0A9P9BQJ2_9PEZI|nr:S-adenosyl-L-methionine-dependent methyltransferase [Microdochium trichocladiopsis]KAH7030933.1 S-adenosyl-L-methionine-dependent methyltransferase [Microdochium trichocladiopsis]
MADGPSPEALPDSGSDPEDSMLSLHNRVFHRFSIDNSISFVPTDHDEHERLLLQHAALSILSYGETIFVPETSLHRQTIRRVLDCGCGNAIWCSETVKSLTAIGNTNFEVTGVDVNDVMLLNVLDQPENLYFDVFDLNQDFRNSPETFPRNHFDFVNSRDVAGGINSGRWDSYIREIFGILRPGGWCQMVELDLESQSDNGRLGDGNALREWSRLYQNAMDKLGKYSKIGRELGPRLRRAGFTDVDNNSGRPYVFPMCGQHEHHVKIGQSNEENVQRLLGSLSLYPFMEVLG